MWYVLFGLLGLFFYSWLIEPALLRIRKEIVEVDAHKLSQPIRLLYISDFHCGLANSHTLQKYHIRRLLRQHQAHPYQALVLGGDYLDRNAAYLSRFKDLLTVLRRFQIPIIATLGNHDYHAYPVHIDDLVKVFQKAGVVVLRNEGYKVQIGENSLFFVGLEELLTTRDYGTEKDHYQLSEYRERARRLPWYQKFDSEGRGMTRILLTHNPDGVYLPGETRPVLALSGHTHGGQIWPLRLLGQSIPFLIPPGSFYIWAGRRVVEGTTLLISRGLGGSMVPFRLFCPPDVLSVTLQPKIMR